MKNIHLLRASKQEYQVRKGGLFINDTRKHSCKKLEALRCERVTQHGYAWNGTGIKTDICHLFITSDEEIKEGDWFLPKGHINPHKLKGFNNISGDLESYNGLCYDISKCKKIILTTDQDLIADGVQAIDDEFLEWFVKNPSCEKVKVSEFRFFNPDTNESAHCKWEYDLPQEEPKQETLEEAAERLYPTDPGVPIDSLNKLDLIKYLNNAKKNEAFIAGAKSDAARDYWFKVFKKK